MSDDIKVYRGDDFGAWSVENNPNRLPVVQFQSLRDAAHPDRIGGWVLREPSDLPAEEWVLVPLQARNETEAVAEARAHL
jgi:hypothetical protein